jgi:hypothetical protein
VTNCATGFSDQPDLAGHSRQTGTTLGVAIAGTVVGSALGRGGTAFTGAARLWWLVFGLGIGVPSICRSRRVLRQIDEKPGFRRAQAPRGRPTAVMEPMYDSGEIFTTVPVCGAWRTLPLPTNSPTCPPP